MQNKSKESSSNNLKIPCIPLADIINFFTKYVTPT